MADKTDVDDHQRHGAKRMKKPGHPCEKPGCLNLISRSRFCDDHKQRPEPRAGWSMSNTKAWRDYSREYLVAHPWCVDPFGLHLGRAVPATVVAHVVGHKGNPQLFYAESNHAPWCRSCNSHQAVEREGGFGRAPKVTS